MKRFLKLLFDIKHNIQGVTEESAFILNGNTYNNFSKFFFFRNQILKGFKN
jgi:hypothetical protein